MNILNYHDYLMELLSDMVKLLQSDGNFDTLSYDTDYGYKGARKYLNDYLELYIRAEENQLKLNGYVYDYNYKEDVILCNMTITLKMNKLYTMDPIRKIIIDKNFVSGPKHNRFKSACDLFEKIFERITEDAIAPKAETKDLKIIKI